MNIQKQQIAGSFFATKADVTIVLFHFAFENNCHGAVKDYKLADAQSDNLGGYA